MSTISETEAAQIKDYLTKLQLLANAINEEKKKSADYLSKIKDYETTLQSKDTQIEILNKEKFDLKSELSLERSKTKKQKNENIFTSIFNKITAQPVDDDKLKKIQTAVEEQKKEIKSLTFRLSDEKEKYEETRMKLQMQVSIKNKDIEDLKEKIKNMQKDKEKLSGQANDIDTKMKQINTEKQEYLNKFAKFEQERKSLEEKNNECNKKLNELLSLNSDKENRNKDLKNKISELSLQIVNLKNESIEKQLSPKCFKVERIKGIASSKKLMNLIFKRNKTTKKLEMQIEKTKGGKNVIYHVNLVEITRFEVNPKYKNQYDIVYFEDGNEEKTSVLVHEMIADEFFDTYRKFSQKASEEEEMGI